MILKRSSVAQRHAAGSRWFQPPYWVMVSPLLAIGPRVTCLPVIHGSGDFALAVRRMMLEQAFDCIAVPLPPSFQADVERGIELLPTPTIVTQPETTPFQTEWLPDKDYNEDDTDLEAASG